jgi:hypothetical protein
VRTAAPCIYSALLLAAPAAAEIPPPGIPPSLSALCPKALPGEIVVCADPDPPKSRYRLPLPTEPDRGDRNTISPSRERNALFDHDSGSIGSCGTVGAAGSYFCGFQKHKSWVEQRAGAPAGGGWLFNKPSP